MQGIVEVLDYVQAQLVHEIHTSERRSFRSCRRRWDWVSRQHYYPIVTAKPLEFGVAYHKAMEVYYNPETWNFDKEVLAAMAEKAFVDTCEAQKAEAIKNTGHLYLEGEQEADYEERVALGRGMLKYFFTKVAPKEDKGWKPVKVEIKFLVPIRHPLTGEEAIWCKCDECFEKWAKYTNLNDGNNPLPTREAADFWNEDIYRDWKGLPVCSAGRLDALAQDDDGNYWVIDWKTAAQIREDHEFLELDDQVTGYVWAMKKAGLNVRGFIYHEQRKAYPVEPKQNKAIRLGRKYSVSKSEPYEYNLYKATIEEYDKEAYDEGLYDEFLQFLKDEGPKYYARYQIYKSDAELESAEYNLGLEALEMTSPNLLIYPSPARFGCSFCAFRVPCLEQNSQSDYRYALDTMFEKKDHYYIRQEASTESKGAE